MADIQVLVDKSPLPPGFSPVSDPLDSSEARVRGWGWGGGAAFGTLWAGPGRGGETTGACFQSLDRPTRCTG